MDARRFFNVVAMGYDWITDQGFWREQIGHVLDFVPPERRAGQIRRVLDIGCGPGVSTFVLARELPMAEVEGVDISEKMVARAQQHLQGLRARGERLENVHFWQGDGAQLGEPCGRYDMVVGHSFLYLVADRAALLAELFRVLAPGGTLVLLEPCQSPSQSKVVVRALGERLGTIPSLLASGHGRRGLGELARFGISLVAWRVVSHRMGPFEPAQLENLFVGAGFADVATHPTLGGIGVHAVGRKPQVPPVATASKPPRKRQTARRTPSKAREPVLSEDQHGH